MIVASYSKFDFIVKVDVIRCTVIFVPAVYAEGSMCTSISAFSMEEKIRCVLISSKTSAGCIH